MKFSIRKFWNELLGWVGNKAHEHINRLWPRPELQQRAEMLENKARQLEIVVIELESEKQVLAQKLDLFKMMLVYHHDQEIVEAANFENFRRATIAFIHSYHSFLARAKGTRMFVDFLRKTLKISPDEESSKKTLDLQPLQQLREFMSRLRNLNPKATTDPA